MQGLCLIAGLLILGVDIVREHGIQDQSCSFARDNWYGWIKLKLRLCVVLIGLPILVVIVRNRQLNHWVKLRHDLLGDLGSGRHGATVIRMCWADKNPPNRPEKTESTGESVYRSDKGHYSRLCETIPRETKPPHGGFVYL